MDLHFGIVEFQVIGRTRVFTRTWIEVEMESSSITAKMVTEAAKMFFCCHV